MIDSANTTKGIIVSAQPSSPETTQNSTGSSQMNWKERSQERWTEVLGKLYAMGQMVGWESIRRGMETEDAVAAAEMKAESAAHMSRIGQSKFGPAPESDEMGDMILGDQKVEHHYHQKGSKLAKVAGLASLALGGAGIGVAAPFVLDMLTPDAPPAEERIIERESNERLEILPPVVRKPEE